MMYCPLEEYEASAYIVTSTGNIVSRNAVICGAENVELPGGKSVLKAGVVVRGDLAKVKIHKCSMVEEETVLKPCTVALPNVKFLPLSIGKYCHIGKRCVIESASIGTGVIVGDDSVLSERTIIRDHCVIEPNTVLPPDMVIPPFSIVSGSPAKIIGEVPESAPFAAQQDAVNRYKAFQPVK